MPKSQDSRTPFLKMMFMYYLFVAALGLHCCTVSSLVVASGGYSLEAVLERLIVVASLVVKHRL